MPRMIAEAAWLVESAGDSALLLEMKADPNDSAEAFVHRSLRGLMNLKTYKATAIGRAATNFAQDRRAQLPVAQTLDFLWFQALASVSALRSANDPPAAWCQLSCPDEIKAWAQLYNCIHPGLNMFTIYFYNRVPWCQYSTGHGRRNEVHLPDGTEVSLAARLPSGQVRYIKGFAFEQCSCGAFCAQKCLCSAASGRAVP